MLMAAPSSTSQLSVSYTPSFPNLLHKQTCLISSGLSIPELREFLRWLHLWGLSPPSRKNCLQDSGHFCLHYSSLCVCLVRCVSAVLVHSAPQWCYSTKKTQFFPASLAPLMCHGQTRLLCSHFPSLSFSPSSPSLALSLRFLLFIGWCRSRTTNQFQSLSQWGLTGPICLPPGQ